MEETRERIELLLTRLYDAALEGNVPSLLILLQEDSLILDRCCIEKSVRFNQSPLHVAANFGHLEFAMEILGRSPRMAEEIDQMQRSPLHVSSAYGHLEIVKPLLEVSQSVCYARDLDGRNPIHVAAIRGQIRVLDELLKVEPLAAQELTNRGETVLHLCVKYKQAKALEHLVKVLDDGELLNFKDSVGNTVLHLAVATGQIEKVKFLLGVEKMEKNVMNANGYTAMDICRMKHSTDPEIVNCLEDANALPGKDAKRLQERNGKRIENQYDALMVVASLIATMAFQVAMSPPGGVWQDNHTLHNLTTRDAVNKTITPGPGESIYGYIDSTYYSIFLYATTVAFLSSVSVILLLISGFRYNRYFAGVLTVIMWIALSATAITYWLGSTFVIPGDNDLLGNEYYNVEVAWLLKVWPLLLACLFLGHCIRAVKNSKLGLSVIRKLPRLHGEEGATTCACPRARSRQPGV